MLEHRVIKAKDTEYIGKDAFGPLDHTEIRWLAGTGFMINTRGTVLLIDPLLTVSQEDPRICEEGLEMVVDYPIKATDVPRLDAVFYTHPDDDHLGRETARALQKLNPLFVGPPSVFEKLVRSDIHHQLIQSCRYGDRITVGNVTVEVIKADHPWQLQDPLRYGKPFRVGDACGYKIYTPDGTFLAPGDSRLMEEHLEIQGVDVLFLDVSRCEYHINVKGATTLANWMSNALVMPYHYGTYNAPDIPAHCGDPEDVFRNVTRRDERVRMLAPGAALCLKEGKEM